MQAAHVGNEHGPPCLGSVRAERHKFGGKQQPTTWARLPCRDSERARLQRRPRRHHLGADEQLDDARSSCVCVQLPLAVLGANKS